MSGSVVLRLYSSKERPVRVDAFLPANELGKLADHEERAAWGSPSLGAASDRPPGSPVAAGAL